MIDDVFLRRLFKYFGLGEWAQHIKMRKKLLQQLQS